MREVSVPSGNKMSLNVESHIGLKECDGCSHTQKQIELNIKQPICS